MCIDTEQWPALALGMASSKTSIERLSQAIVSRYETLASRVAMAGLAAAVEMDVRVCFRLRGRGGG